MEMTWKRFLKITLLALVTALVSGAFAGPWAEESHEGHADEPHSSSVGFRFGAFRTWMFRSFMRDEGDDASVLGLEFETYLGLGHYEIKNIAYFEVAQYPRAIPGQPPGNPGNPDTSLVAADGINDLLTAFLVSKKTTHHGKHHFAPGWAMQFPTASDETLGSGKWSIGPEIDSYCTSGDYDLTPNVVPITQITNNSFTTSLPAKSVVTFKGKLFKPKLRPFPKEKVLIKPEFTP